MLSAVIRDPGLQPALLATQAGISERTLRRDLTRLRRLGFDVRYRGGYQFWESLELDGPAVGGRLGVAAERLLAAMRQELPAPVADAVSQDVIALLPAAMASLIASALEHRVAGL